MNFKQTLLGLGCLCFAASTAWGQGYAPPGYGYGYYQAGAATAEESWARGMSDVIRSAGEANLNNSAAAINYSEAQSMQMENQLQYTETYFEMRRINREARAAEQGPPVTAEQAARIASERMPDRLSVSQLDPVSGAIRWPMILRSDAFAEDRDAIDALSNDRAETGGSIGPDTYQELQTHIRSMQSTLKGMARDVEPDIYLSGKNFLDSLAYEVRFAATQ